MAVQIHLTPFDSADDAIQHGDAAGENAIHAINVPGVRYATITDQELERVGRLFDFAFVTVDEKTNRVVTIPVDCRAEV